MERIKVIESRTKTIVIVDYSSTKEKEMIEIVSEATKTIKNINKRILAIAIYDDNCYVTPKFMRFAEEATKELLPLIENQAMVGMNHVKKMILKGYNQNFNWQIENFDTVDEAMKFLLNE
jgi:Pyruvate/2-oxoacid:ferredoxin oxidoreductase gamma subunit